MTEKEQEHDKLAYRLATILQRLNDGNELNPPALAKEFNVTLRTIQRDLNERFSFLPLEKKEGLYSIRATYFGGALGYGDIQRFAALAGLHGLFPSLDSQFLREILDTRIKETLLVQGPQFEEAGDFQATFRNIQHAIGAQLPISFHYQKPGAAKLVQAHPYKLINHIGVWYLAATDQDDQHKPKAYTLSKIDGLLVGDTPFNPDAAVQAMLKEEDSIWLNHNKTEAVLKVDATAAHYFKRRKLIASQQIVKELEDGGLLVSGKFAHPNQIVPIVRYWLPHVRIVSPEEWQADLEQQLQAYLDG